MTIETSEAAAALGRLGGMAGKGKDKSRTEQLKARWAGMDPAARALVGRRVWITRRKNLLNRTSLNPAS